jgi:hypothetical protein
VTGAVYPMMKLKTGQKNNIVAQLESQRNHSGKSEALVFLLLLLNCCVMF